MPEAARAAVLVKVRSIPVVSAAAAKVLTLMRDPNADAASVERGIRYDVNLTATILRMANSAFFGSPGRIGSIRQAVVLLGWKRVYQLVVASSVHAVMEGRVPGYDLPPGELWRHSVAVAVAAETLMRHVRASVPEETFTAALLHDVGKLVLGEAVAASLGPIQESVSRGASFEAAEKQAIGMDHAEAGALVLENWTFPQTVVEAVRWHHEPYLAGSPSAVVDLVHVADVQCLMAGILAGADGPQYKPAESSMQRLELRMSDLEETADAVRDNVEDVIRSLKMDAPRGDPARREPRSVETGARRP